MNTFLNRSFTTRLAASTPFNLFLNKTFSVKGTHDDPLGLVLPDILSPKLGDLVESAQVSKACTFAYVVVVGMVL